MAPRLVDVLFLLGYIVIAPVVIWMFDLGGLGWLVYASTLAIASAVSLSVATLKLKLQG